MAAKGSKHASEKIAGRGDSAGSPRAKGLNERHDDPNESRREFLRHSGLIAGATAATSLAVPQGVHAGNDQTLRLGIVGCGGRGRGAVSDALAGDPHVVLSAVGDAFQDQVELSLRAFRENDNIKDRVQVDNEHIFTGFDAYKQVIDSGVDVVILTTSPHFRPQHLRYAVEAGKHCFVEKPIAVDAPGVRHVAETCEIARQKGLAIVSGLCWRYHPAVQETIGRIHDGAVGDIIAIESQYNAGTLWHRPQKPDWSAMEYQMRNWLYYTWLSGDHIVEQAVHSLDKTSWLLRDATPVRAGGMGGRQQRTDPRFGHIFDHHTVFYEYEEGVKVFFTCRQQAGCSNNVDEHVLGTAGAARVLKHVVQNGWGTWEYQGPSHNMYQLEHEAMFRSIRDGEPINNGSYMVNSTMIAIMGRMCTYTGQDLTWEQCWNSQERLGPTEYHWGDVPVPDVAIPGKTQFV